MEALGFLSLVSVVLQEPMVQVVAVVVPEAVATVTVGAVKTTLEVLAVVVVPAVAAAKVGCPVLAVGPHLVYLSIAPTAPVYPFYSTMKSWPETVEMVDLVATVV
jgi:hypothetical protein